jgi:micrococcal nuclease
LTLWTTAGLRVGCAGVLLLLCASLATADFSGPVVSVLDGDTIEVLHNNRPERIRLSGIDCPEKGQAYGTRVKQAASELVYGKEVTLQTHGKDKYGRTLAYVLLLDGTNVNHTLVEEGWCWWYRKYAPGDTVLEGLENEAREAKKGLWADPHPVPPWSGDGYEATPIDEIGTFSKLIAIARSRRIISLAPPNGVLLNYLLRHRIFHLIAVTPRYHHLTAQENTP